MFGKGIGRETFFYIKSIRKVRPGIFLLMGLSLVFSLALRLMTTQFPKIILERVQMQEDLGKILLELLVLIVCIILVSYGENYAGSALFWNSRPVRFYFLRQMNQRRMTMDYETLMKPSSQRMLDVARMAVSGDSAPAQNYAATLTEFMAAILALRDGIGYACLIALFTQGKVTVGEFVLYIGVISQLSASVMGLAKYYNRLAEQSVQLEELRMFLNIPEPQRGVRPMPMGENYTLELKNVSFRYTADGPWVLRNISMVIHSREKLALIGSNGAGKSTLIQLICGFCRRPLQRMFPVIDWKILTWERCGTVWYMQDWMIK